MAKQITDVDKAIGAHIREFRKANRLSQSKLAEKLNVTFQQVQKYENGKNRVSVSSFIVICKTLGIEPADILGSYFGADGEGTASALISEVTSLRNKLSQIKNIAA